MQAACGLALAGGSKVGWLLWLTAVTANGRVTSSTDEPRYLLSAVQVPRNNDISDPASVLVKGAISEPYWVSNHIGNSRFQPRPELTAFGWTQERNRVKSDLGLLRCLVFIRTSTNIFFLSLRRWKEWRNNKHIVIISQVHKRLFYLPGYDFFFVVVNFCFFVLFLYF